MNDEKKYYFGDRFIHPHVVGNEEYILAKVDSIGTKVKAALIELKSGNRWTNPIIVGEETNIALTFVTGKEWQKLTCGREFIPVK